ncbi:hypothetical protein [Methylobacterium frigidaeris]|uniref:Uncharacterized protein n=1 Tax=Methylobacterium frigidaeris TaxID=2038277 RepID=A0AA37HES0_9HYPH|nr:hypothetical protein [Methylobacterium frigidaeris]GJD64408.1 hypothetical protein MPEAHAMD_4590 [Methylobacterium frigidaeris]
MGVLFAVLGLVTFVAGLAFTSTIRSDIQIQIVVTLLVGGIIMSGIGIALSRLKKIARAVIPEAPPAPKRDPYA